MSDDWMLVAILIWLIAVPVCAVLRGWGPDDDEDVRKWH